MLVNLLEGYVMLLTRNPSGVGEHGSRRRENVGPTA